MSSLFLVNVVFVKLAIRWVGGRVVLLNIRNGLVKPFNTEAVYHEESGYLAYFRGSFNADGLTSKVPGNILFDHQREHHPRKELTLKDDRDRDCQMAHTLTVPRGSHDCQHTRVKGGEGV